MFKKLKNAYLKTTKKIFEVVDLHKRSSHWRKVQKQVISNHPFCAGCGVKSHLQAHHIRPFHLYPELELSLDNLVVLCMKPGKECHFYIGHAGSWKTYNPNLIRDLQLLDHDAKQRSQIILEAKKNRLYDRSDDEKH